jgi:hypothetical protein
MSSNKRRKIESSSSSSRVAPSKDKKVKKLKAEIAVATAPDALESPGEAEAETIEEHGKAAAESPPKSFKDLV